MPKQTSATTTVNLDSDQPTTLTFKQLHDWVVWQIPKPVAHALSGAVRPATPDHKWYPAIVDVKKGNVQVFGHLGKLFESPEKASDYLISVRQ